MDAALGRAKLGDRKPIKPKFKARRWLFVLSFSSVESKDDRWQYFKNAELRSNILIGDQYLTDEMLYRYAEIYHDADRSTIEILYKAAMPRSCPKWLEPPLQELLLMLMGIKMTWKTLSS